MPRRGRRLAGDALEYIDGPAAPFEHDAGQEPAHRSANDQRAAPAFHGLFLLIPAISQAGKVFYIVTIIIEGTPWL